MAKYTLKSNDVVTGLYVCDALTNGLDDTSTLVSEDNGEGTLRVLAGQCVGICVADTGVVDLNADLVGPGGKDFDILNGEVLAGFPGNGGLCWSVQLFGPFTFVMPRSPRVSAAQCLCAVCGSASAKLGNNVTDGEQRSWRASPQQD